jgi:hypothetical protein
MCELHKSQKNSYIHGAANLRLILGKMIKLGHFRRMFIVAQLIGVWLWEPAHTHIQHMKRYSNQYEL